MAIVHSLGKLIKFIRRPEWEDDFADILGQHLGPACSNHEVGPDDLFDIVGEVAATVLHGCALEDYMSRVDDDGHNIVDEYLKRRGYAESAGAKRYMQSFRNTVMSLYEVSDIVPGQSFLARDLLRECEPVRVMEVSGTKSLRPSDRIGARLFWQGEEGAWAVACCDLSAGRRSISSRHLRALTPSCRQIARLCQAQYRCCRCRRHRARNAVTPPLAIMAPTFTGIWLADLLERTLHPQVPELLNTDGHAIVMSTSTFPLLFGVKASACRMALIGVPGLIEAGLRISTGSAPKG